MIFSASSLKRPKKWMSAIIALIFLLNVCSPAWAIREGNYGDTTSLEAFGAGFLSGAVTDIFIMWGGGCTGSFAAAIGSIVSNIVGVYMYYNNYEDYGKPVMSFDLFGTEVTIGRGQFWSMVAGIVASCIAGVVAGALGAGAKCAVKGAAEGAAENVGKSMVQSTVEGAAKGTTQAAIDETVKNISEETLKEKIRAILSDMLKKLAAAASEAEKNAIKAAAAAEIAELVASVIETAIIEALAAAGENLTQGTVDSVVSSVVSTIANSFGSAVATASTTTVETIVKGLVNELAASAPKTFTEQVSRVGFKLLVDLPTGMAKLLITRSVEEVLVEKCGWDRTYAKIVGGLASTFVGFGIAMLSARGASTLVKAISGKEYGINNNGEVVDRAQIDALNKSASATTTLGKEMVKVDGKEVKVATAAGDKSIQGQLTKDDLQKVMVYSEAVKAASFMPDIPRTTDGRSLQGDEVSNLGAFFGAMRSLGLRPIVTAAAQVAMLEALNYETYRGRDKDKNYKNSVKMAIASGVGTIAGEMTANWDGLGSLYSGTANNPWGNGANAKSERLPETEKLGYWQNIGLLAAKEAGGTLAEIAFAKMNKDSNLDTSGGTAGLVHLAASSAVSGAIDAARGGGSISQYPRAVAENFNNYFVHAAADSVLLPTPNSPGTQLGSYTAHMSNMNKWTNTMEAASRGTSPMQSQAARAGQNLSYYAASDFGNSVGYAVANTWLPENYQQRPEFVANSEAWAQERGRSQEYVSKAKEELDKLNALDANIKRLQAKRDKLEKDLAEKSKLSKIDTDTVLYDDTTGSLGSYLTKEQIQEQLKGIDKEIVGLAKDQFGDIARLTETGRVKLDNPQEAAQLIASSLPKAISRLEGEINKAQAGNLASQQAEKAMDRFGWLPVVGAMVQTGAAASVAGARKGYDNVDLPDLVKGGIVDYTVTKGVDEAGKEKGKGKADRSYFATKTYVPSVAGIPQEIKEYGKASGKANTIGGVDKFSSELKEFKDSKTNTGPYAASGSGDVLLNSTSRDRFGRQVETTYYNPEINSSGSLQSTLNEDKVTKHYYGVFGNKALSETTDYSNVKLPDTWPAKETTPEKTDWIPGPTQTNEIETAVKNLFDFNKSDIREDQKPKLKEALEPVKKFLEDNPQENIRLTGRTDARGSVAYNYNLGIQRAEAVKQTFVEMGIPAERIITGSLGETNAAVPESASNAAREVDRYVKFEITTKTEIPGEKIKVTTPAVVEDMPVYTGPNITRNVTLYGGEENGKPISPYGEPVGTIITNEINSGLDAGVSQVEAMRSTGAKGFEIKYDSLGNPIGEVKPLPVIPNAKKNEIDATLDMLEKAKETPDYQRYENWKKIGNELKDKYPVPQSNTIDK